MLTARQKLAQSLSFTLKERKIPASYVSSRCRVPLVEIVRWLDGSLVPNSGEWVDLNKYILRKVVPDSLWQDAKMEQDEEHRKTLRSLDKANQSDEKSDRIVTKPPTHRTHVVSAAPPRSTKSGHRKSTREERRRYAKGIILQRPGIRVGGEDGLQVLVRQRFRIGIDPRVVSDIRREIASEHKHAEVQAPESPSAVSIIPTIQEDPNSKDLIAGVELLLGAVPNLQKLILTRDANGEVAVEYKIKKIEIQTVGGSIKIRSK